MEQLRSMPRVFVGGLAVFRRKCVEHNILNAQDFRRAVQRFVDVHQCVGHRRIWRDNRGLAEQAVVHAGNDLRTQNRNRLIGAADQTFHCLVERSFHVVGDFQRIACPAFPCADEKVGVDVGVNRRIGVLGVLRQRGDCKDCQHQGEDKGNQLLHGDVPAFQKSFRNLCLRNCVLCRGVFPPCMMRNDEGWGVVPIGGNFFARDCIHAGDFVPAGATRGQWKRTKFAVAPLTPSRFAPPCCLACIAALLQAKLRYLTEMSHRAGKMSPDSMAGQSGAW